jgi:hypothetical protein
MDDEDLRDFNVFLPYFQKETDRGAALVGAARIDDKLKETLTAFFANRKVGKALLDGELGTLSARTKAAFCLGLIGRDEYDECNTIRQIRNAFAHSAKPLEFSDPDIAKQCFNLKLAVPTNSRLIKENPRYLFLHSVFWVALGLNNRAKQVARQKRVIMPNNPIRQLEAHAGVEAAA